MGAADLKHLNTTRPYNSAPPVSRHAPLTRTHANTLAASLPPAQHNHPRSTHKHVNDHPRPRPRTTRPFVHLSTPWLTGTARPRSALPARCRKRAAAAPSARRRRVTASGISSWKPAFEAAVLNTPLSPPTSAPSPSGAPSAAPPAPTRGLTADRLRRLLRITKRLSTPFFRRDRSAKWHALACASLSVLESALGAVFTVVIGNLFTALNERNVAAFWNGNIYVFALCVILFPLAACSRFTRSTFVLRWQQFLTKSGLRMYFGGSNYYKLNGAQKSEGEVGTEDGLDNPDEVIDQQFAEFASSMVDFTLTNLKTVVDVVLYSVILLQIFPPMYFVIVVIVAVGMLLVNRIGKRLFDLQALLLRRTAVREQASERWCCHERMR